MFRKCIVSRYTFFVDFANNKIKMKITAMKLFKAEHDLAE